MSASTRNLRHGTLILRDGTSITPNTLTIPIAEGDLDFTITKNILRVMNRGKIDHKRDGDEVEMDIKFSFKFEQWSYAAGASTGVSPADVLLRAGGAAAWVSTGVSCGPWAIDLVFQIKDPCSATAYEQLVFSGFTPESINFKEGSDSNMVSVTGKAQITAPVRTWVA
jgi:hypothetical protein